MVATCIETAAHQPSDRFSIMPILNRKKKMCPELKVIMLGNAGVGKTSLLASLTGSAPERSAAMGVDFRVKMASLNGEIVKLQLWDTADQEKHGAAMLPKSYYRRARGAFLVYDACDGQSLRDVARWAIQLQTFHDDSDPLSVVLVANHTGCPSEPQVSSTQGRALATLLDASFVECSSMDGPESCLEQLITDLSKPSGLWNIDVDGLVAHAEAIASLLPVEKPTAIKAESESETESESEDSELELDDATPQSTNIYESASLVLPAKQRRDSRLFMALELGGASVSAAGIQWLSPRALARAALVAGGVLLCASPIALLALNGDARAWAAAVVP